MTTDDQKIALEKIRAGDRLATKKLYAQLFRPCTYPVFNNGGNMEDAKEVFQEAFVSLLTKLKDPTFSVKVSLKAYLRQTCFNIWVGKKRATIKESPVDTSEYDIAEDTSELDIKNLKEEQFKLMYACLKKSSDECQQLLRLFFYEKKRDKEIATIMNYEAGFVRNKRRRCLNSLRECMGIKN